MCSECSERRQRTSPAKFSHLSGLLLLPVDSTKTNHATQPASSLFTHGRQHHSSKHRPRRPSAPKAADAPSLDGLIVAASCGIACTFCRACCDLETLLLMRLLSAVPAIFWPVSENSRQSTIGASSRIISPFMNPMAAAASPPGLP